MTSALESLLVLHGTNTAYFDTLSDESVEFIDTYKENLTSLMRTVRRSPGDLGLLALKANVYKHFLGDASM